MKKIILLISALCISILSGCNTGDSASSYSTVFGDITIVDNGGTNTSTKTNKADVNAAKELQNFAEEKADQKVGKKISK